MSKVWLVTGSARGLGRSIAEAVLAHGDRLAATARQPERLADLAERYGDHILPIELDVRRVDQAKRAVQAAVEKFGRIDVVVNNAAYGNIASLEEATEEEFRDQIETDLWGVIHVTRAVLPTLRAQRSGHILQISSIGGRIGTAGVGAYQTAKWGVEGFSEVLAKETAALGIRVTIVEPGYMATDWSGSSMRFTEPGEDYQSSVGWVIRMLEKMNIAGTPLGSEPAKVAQVLLKVVDESEPPLRLLIGSDSVQRAMMNDEARLAETRKWEALSRSTDVS